MQRELDEIIIKFDKLIRVRKVFFIEFIMARNDQLLNFLLVKWNRRNWKISKVFLALNSMMIRNHFSQLSLVFRNSFH